MAKFFKLPVKDKDFVGSLNSFLHDMLKNECVDALLVPQEVPSGDNVVQTLVKKADRLKGANPASPVMGINSAKIVSGMTKFAPSTQKVGVVLKSCELRALVELVKLKQASLENLIIIGIDCFGTYPLKQYKNIVDEGKSPLDEIVKIAKGDVPDSDLRSACRVCEHFEPQGADILIGLIGMDLEKEILLAANTAEGERILRVLKLQGSEMLGARAEAISKLTSQRIQSRDKLFEETKKEIGSPDKLLSFFSTCIKCHNCMGVCPICYCRECFFESPTFEFGSEKYLQWAERKGAVKLPTDTILFHLTRMNHMLLSCVGCGLCEEACPNEIPVFKPFRTFGQSAQKLLDYVPGQSLEDELPLTTFKEDELEEVGE